MFTIALCLHIFIVITMIVIILIQRSEGGGFATFNGGVAGSRGVSDFLTKTTSVLVVLFFCSSIFLTILVKEDLKKEKYFLGKINDEIKISSGGANMIESIPEHNPTLDDIRNGSSNDLIPEIEIPMDFG